MVGVHPGRDDANRFGANRMGLGAAHHGFCETLSLGCKAAWNRNNFDALVDGASGKV
jgi:hypothetical protein